MQCASSTVTSRRSERERRARNCGSTTRPGRDGEDPDGAARERPPGSDPFCVGHGAVDRRGGDAGRCKGIDLVFHERDERRGDDRKAAEEEGRERVAERFPPGREDCRDISPGEDSTEGLLLERPEARVAEVSPEYLGLCGHRPPTVERRVCPGWGKRLPFTPVRDRWAYPG